MPRAFRLPLSGILDKGRLLLWNAVLNERRMPERPRLKSEF